MIFLKALKSLAVILRRETKKKAFLEEISSQNADFSENELENRVCKLETTGSEPFTFAPLVSRAMRNQSFPERNSHFLLLCAKLERTTPSGSWRTFRRIHWFGEPRGFLRSGEKTKGEKRGRL